MKKNWKVWSVIGILFLVVILAIAFSIQSSMKNAKINKEETIVTVEGKKVVALFNDKKDAVVYIGRPTCDKCQAFRPLLEEALAENKQSVLYYNTDDGKKDDFDNFEEVIAKTEITSVPAVVVIKDGHVTNRLDSFKDEAKIKTFLAEND